MCSGILPFVILILINLFQTRMKKQLISVMVAASLLTACGGAPKTTAKAEKFDYTVEQFADLQILRYKVPGFEELTLKQKEIPTQRIRAYEIGADRWIDIVSDRLGEEGTAGNMTLYLDEKALRADAPEREKTRNYTFDPATPVESIGGEALLHTMPQIGSHLQPEPDYREDVLSFVSEPLEETFTLNGKASVRLFVESDCEDTAFTAKIMEVTPEGKAYNIRSSIATLEQGKTEAGAYEAGSVAEVQITMWNIVYTIPKGSCIRVDVSSSDFPQYHVHSNQKGLWSEKTENKIAHQTIHMGRKAASCVILPLMKKQ